MVCIETNGENIDKQGKRDETKEKGEFTQDGINCTKEGDANRHDKQERTMTETVNRDKIYEWTTERNV